MQGSNQHWTSVRLRRILEPKLTRENLEVLDGSRSQNPDQSRDRWLPQHVLLTELSCSLRRLCLLLQGTLPTGFSQPHIQFPARLDHLCSSTSSTPGCSGQHQCHQDLVQLLPPKVDAHTSGLWEAATLLSQRSLTRSWIFIELLYLPRSVSCSKNMALNKIDKFPELMELTLCCSQGCEENS